MQRVELGRKNGFFVGSDRFGMHNPHLIGLENTAHRNDLDEAMNIENLIMDMMKRTAWPEESLPDVWMTHDAKGVRVYSYAETIDKTLSLKQQNAGCRLKSELRKQLGGLLNLSSDTRHRPEKKSRHHIRLRWSNNNHTICDAD